MSWTQQQQPTYATAELRDERVSSFLSKVYGWMFIGLLITSGTALAVASSESLTNVLVHNHLVFLALIIGQLGLVFYLSARVHNVQPVTAAGRCMLYSALTGVTTSVVLLAYTGASIVSTFIVTAGMFGATAIFGTLTKRSLAGVGQFMFMGLIGLILASVVGIFWQNDALQFVIS